MGSESDGLRPWGRAPSVTGRGRSGIDDPGSDIFFAAIETSRMPMVLSDPSRPDNPIVFANQAFCRLTGYAHGDIIGRNCRFLQGVDTDADALDEVRRAIRGRHEVSTELLNYRKDGTSFWNALFVSPVFDASGALVYFFASQLDVSRRRDAEDALRGAQMAGTLAQQAGEIGHDFANLLQIIGGTAESLKRRGAGSDDPRTARQLGALVEAADRATALTRRLLALAHEGGGDGRVVALNELLGGLRERLDRVPAGGAGVTLALADGLWNARLDPARVEAALLDMVSAARAALPGGSVVTLATANLEVAAGGTGPLAPGRYATVALSTVGGRLPSLRAQAERCGGAVQVEGAPDRDAAVRLCFAAAHRLPGPEIAPEAGAPAGGNERVLVVDDRHDVAEIARTMLEDAGYDVEIAEDGQAALDRLDRGFDLLFSDLVMPGGIDGLTLARHARLRHPALKVLLTTGQTGTADARAGIEFETIAKPYRRRELAKKVRSVLDGAAGSA